jgi:hypothetical protein
MLPFCYPTRQEKTVRVGTNRLRVRHFAEQTGALRGGTLRERTAASELQNRCSTAELNRRIEAIGEE